MAKSLDAGMSAHADLPTVPLSYIKKTLKMLLKTRARAQQLNLEYDEPLTYFISTPGEGKTATITQFAKEEGFELECRNLLTMDRMDTAGLPYLGNTDRAAAPNNEAALMKELATLGGLPDKTTKFAPVEWLMNLSKEYNPNGKPTMLYLIEFSSVPDILRPIFYQLTNERRIGNLHLRDNVMMVADANPPSAVGRNVARDLLPPEKGRVLQVYVENSLDEWEEHELSRGADAVAIPFLKRIDENAFRAETFQSTLMGAFPSPRSWSKFHDQVPVLLEGLRERGKFENDEEVMLRAVACGFLGHKTGTAFCAYLKNHEKMVKTDELLDQPEKAVELAKAEDMSLTCYTMDALARHCASRGAKGDFTWFQGYHRVIKTMLDSSVSKYPDLAVMSYKTLLHDKRVGVNANTPQAAKMQELLTSGKDDLLTQVSSFITGGAKSNLSRLIGKVTAGTKDTNARGVGLDELNFDGSSPAAPMLTGAAAGGKTAGAAKPARGGKV